MIPARIGKMKIEQTAKNSYRVKKMVKGKTYTVTFDHKPSQKEITIALAEKIQDEPGKRGSFEKYANEYIENRKNVISPATVRTYDRKIKQLSDEFKAKNLYDITSEDVQKEINKFSVDHEPKTTKTLHGFVASVLYAYRPNFNLRTKLPQIIVKKVYEPSNEDIQRILEAVKGTEYSIAFQLGVLGCRRGEICALDINDLDGNELRIHRSKVYLDGEWIVKDTPKTSASNRVLYLPDSLVAEIKEKGYIYKGYPVALLKTINRCQDRLDIPRFKFHALRSYFASYAHSMGIPEADILAIGGWETDNVMKKVYRKSLEFSKQKSMEKLTKGLIQ